MSSERSLIAAVVLLGVGLGLILGYTHGSATFTAAYPVSGTLLQVSINTVGLAAMAGFVATVLGTVVLVVAFVQAIVGQALSRKVAKHDRLPV